MAVLKAPPKQPKTTVVQLRLDDEAKMKLAKYAEFLDCSPSYVVTEALKLVYPQRQRLPVLAIRPTHKESTTQFEGRRFPTGTEIETMHRRLQFGMRENPASDRRHGSRLAVRNPTNDGFVKEMSPRQSDSMESRTHPQSAMPGFPHVTSRHATWPQEGRGQRGPSNP